MNDESHQAMQNEAPERPCKRFEFTEAKLKNLDVHAILERENEFRDSKGLKRETQMLLYDEGRKSQAGLIVQISAGRGTKTFHSYFVLHGVARKRKIGRVGVLPLERARKIVALDQDKAAQGIDPRQEARQRREAAKQAAAETYQAVVDEFIEKYAKPRQRSWEQTQAALKSKYLRDWFDRPIRSISETDAYDVLDALIAEGKDPTAKLLDAWIKTLWKWAYGRRKLDAPVMDRLNIEFELKTRDRVYSDDELAAIWWAAEAMGSDPKNELGPYERDFFKLLLLLVPRKTALANLRRSHLDDPDNPTLWETPFELTKSKKRSKPRVYLIPLPPIAQRILKGVKRNDAEPDLVFPGNPKKSHPRNSKKQNEHPSLYPGTGLSAKLKKYGAPEDFTYHAVRHTAATHFENAGYSEFELSVLLNHSTKGSGATSSYSHGYPLELKRKMHEEWAAHIESLITPKGVALLR